MAIDYQMHGFFVSKQSWDEFFDGITLLESINTKNFSDTCKITSTSCFISNSLFQDVHNPIESGSGIRMYVDSAHLLVELSTFTNCTSNFNGAAISFVSAYGNCIINKCCSTYCHSTYSDSGYSDGQFLYSTFNPNDQNINKVIDTTIYKSEDQNKHDSRTTVRIYGGKIEITNINMSMNNLNQQSTIWLNPAINQDSIIDKVKFSSFVDNYARNCIVINFNTEGLSHLMSYCNFIRNKQGTEHIGVIHSGGGELTLENSCLVDNDREHYFFSVFNGHINLINCSIEETQINNANGITLITTENWKPSPASFILKLTHTHNEFCLPYVFISRRHYNKKISLITLINNVYLSSSLIYSC